MEGHKKQTFEWKERTAMFLDALAAMGSSIPPVRLSGTVDMEYAPNAAGPSDASTIANAALLWLLEPRIVLNRLKKACASVSGGRLSVGVRRALRCRPLLPKQWR